MSASLPPGPPAEEEEEEVAEPKPVIVGTPLSAVAEESTIPSFEDSRGL